MFRKRTAIAAAVIAVASLSPAVLLRGSLFAHSEEEPSTVGVAKASIRDVTAQPFSPTPDPAIATPVPAVETSEAMQGLTLVRPRFQRGGYGSKALLSFTIQNRNDFPVKDVAMRCEFAGRDGRFTTSRTRMLPDIVRTKSRKRYGPTLIGFLGVTYGQARCAIVNASRADV